VITLYTAARIGFETGFQDNQDFALEVSTRLQQLRREHRISLTIRLENRRFMRFLKIFVPSQLFFATGKSAQGWRRTFLLGSIS
jgi:hypothetical protein